MDKNSESDLINMLVEESNLTRIYLNQLCTLFDTVLLEVDITENEKLAKVMNSVNEILNEDIRFLRKFTPEELKSIFCFDKVDE